MPGAFAGGFTLRKRHIMLDVRRSFSPSLMWVIIERKVGLMTKTRPQACLEMLLGALFSVSVPKR